MKDDIYKKIMIGNESAFDRAERINKDRDDDNKVTPKMLCIEINNKIFLELFPDSTNTKYSFDDIINNGD